MTALADFPALTRAEQELRTAFSQGRLLDLTKTGPRRAFDGGPADATRTLIRAWVIRDLLLSDASVTPGRVRHLSVTGAAIKGELDLRFAKTDCPLQLEDCTFDRPVTLYEAHLRSVSLRKCTIPGIDARHVTVTGDLHLDEVHLTGRLQLGGAHLGDDLHLAGATIGSSLRTGDARGGATGSDDGDGNDALLDLENIEVKGKIDARGLTVHGKVSTTAATVAGTLLMRQASIRTVRMVPDARRDMVAWSGEGMTVEGSLDAGGLRATGQVRLIDTQVLGLVLRNAWIRNSGYALVLDRLASRGSVFCDGNSRMIGGIHAIGIQVGATLYLGAGLMRAPAKGQDEDRYAVDLRRAKITGDLKCQENFRARGACNLAGAHIGGSVSFEGASLRSVAGRDGQPAFTADGTQMDSDLCFKRAPTKGSGADAGTGFACQGVISLVNARVGGSFTVEQDERGRGNRCTLTATGLSVTRDVKLDMAGTVDLSGADITGDLTLDLGRLAADKNKAAADLNALSADVLTLRGRPSTGFLDLTRASVSLLRDNPQDWPAESRLVLDGLEYVDITTTGEADDEESYRLKWLGTGTQCVRETAGKYKEVGFTPQPYQQLADVYRAAGSDRQARGVLHAMYCAHNAEINSFRRHPFIKLWNSLQNVFLGYGYVPSRALAWLIGLAVFTSIWLRYFDKSHVGLVQAAIMSLGLELPGAGYEKIEGWAEAASTASHVIAALLVLCGLLLGATVIAAVARVIRR